MNQAGGEYSVYRGSVYQKGYGLGGSFRKFFSWIIPLVKKHALPHIESGIKSLGKEALSTVSHIAKDVVAGKNIKESAEDRINTAIDNIKEKTDKALEGRGIKRKKNPKKYLILKKRQKTKQRSLDIFD